jgi:4-diphosphocytidyl-2-C-methyl-D-erythritol kinase
MDLRKRIPMGAGLGGGSSDAAAALRGVVALAGRQIAPLRMLEIAAGLGADVPFFLLGGTALGLGRGTEVYELKDSKREWLVLARPPVHVNTAQAYAQFDAHSSLTERQETNKIYSFCASSWDRRGVWPVNDFEPVVFASYPQIARLKKWLVAEGASPALMSGSGSAVYGFCGSREKAGKVARKMAAKFPECQVWVLRTVKKLDTMQPETI